MFDMPRACKLAASDGNGYVETDPSGRYGRFDDVLGKGATKTVYRAFDELNGTEVAWNQAKLCDVMRNPDTLERMYAEVHLLSSLKHDSIISFHSSWIDVDNRTFNFITELFTSGTLREYRQRYRRVDIKAIKNWARQILNGLVYLHSHDPPVIHRDLKSDNIFVNGHLGQVKIGDLGLAAVLRGSRCAHSVIGTPEFMAPELYEEEYNELVDIYSFGMCMVEMLTSEYPYCECENPAQIYKKVTSGKLPGAFHQIQDPETKRFIRRCLENVSKRSTAEELLLDPFLSSNDHSTPLPESRTGASSVHLQLPEIYETSPRAKNRDMTITGKMNDEDDAIILKVQMTDKHGKLQNIYFPFDVVGDTPIDVANEMVKELEITDLKPEEIAGMIAQEIALLLPSWHRGGSRHSYNYDDDEEDGNKHPFCYISSPNSSQGSVFGMVHSQSQSGLCKPDDWLRDGQLTDDETSSMNSGVYSAMKFISGHADGVSKQTTRLGSLTKEFGKKCGLEKAESGDSAGHRRGGKQAADKRRLTRNKSMVDVRSQLLHRTLVDELKKRLFKTVGAVENVGFRDPREGSSSSGKSKQKKDAQTERKRR